MSWFSNVTRWIGDQVNNLTGKNAAMEKQQELNLELARKQYSNSVQGMKDAGLNPAMMYSNSTASPVSGVGQSSAANTGITTSVSSLLNSAANLARSFNNDRNPNNDVSFKDLKYVANTLSKFTNGE